MRLIRWSVASEKWLSCFRGWLVAVAFFFSFHPKSCESQHKELLFFTQSFLTSAPGWAKKQHPRNSHISWALPLIRKMKQFRQQPSFSLPLNSSKRQVPILGLSRPLNPVILTPCSRRQDIPDLGPSLRSSPVFFRTVESEAEMKGEGREENENAGEKRDGDRQRWCSEVQHVFKYATVISLAVFTPPNPFQPTAGITGTPCPFTLKTSASRHRGRGICLSAVEGRRRTRTRRVAGRKESSHMGKVCQETQLCVLGASLLTDRRRHTHTHTLLYAVPAVRDGYVWVLCRLVARMEDDTQD